MTRRFRFVAVLFAATLAVFLSLRWPFASWPALRASLAGHCLNVAAPQELALPMGSHGTAKLTLQNLSHFSINVYGVQSGCSCLAPSNVPLRLGPRSQAELVFTIYAGNVAGVKTVPVRLFVEGESNPLPAEFKVVVMQPTRDFDGM